MRSKRCCRRFGLLPIAVLLFLCQLAPSAPAQQQTYDEYVKAVHQSIDLGDDKRLVRTVKGNIPHTLAHYRGLVMADMQRGTTETLAEREALQKAWQGAFDGDTLQQFDRWLQTVGSSTLQNFDTVQKGLREAYAEYARLRQGVKDRKSWEALIQSTMKIAEAFNGMGAKLEAADAWGLVAQVYNSMPDKTLEDRKQAMFAIDQFFQLRSDWNFTKDESYMLNQSWAKAEKEAIKAEEESAAKRESEGYGADVKGVEAYLVPNADAEELVGVLEFEPLKKPKDEDMSLWAGPVPPQWGSVYVEKEGPQALQWFKGAELYLVRPGSSKFGISLSPESDLDKNPFVEVEAANKVRDATVFPLDASGDKKYAMWFYVGGNQERFQGYNQNLAPQPELARVFFKSASSWTTEIDGEEITFYDDNTNGKLFEDDPMAFGMKSRHLGESFEEEVPVPMFDAVKVGRADPQPLSSWMKLNDSWYHVRGKDDGAKVGFRKANPEYFKTGEIQADWSGPRGTKLTLLIVRGRGDFAGTAFDIADGKPHEVPVGTYELAFGRIESGRGARQMTAHVFGGPDVTVTVEEGETAKFDLGEPFRLDFKKQAAGNEVSIHAATIRIRGKAGELYAYVNGAVAEPVVLVSRSENGRGAREEGEFRAIDNPDLALAVGNQVSLLGSDFGYYPLPKGSQGDPVLKVEVPDGFFVGLQQKKNKLFGDLEPVWK